MGEIADTFGEIINDIKGATSGAGAARFGRMVRGQVYEGRVFAPTGGAALLVTMDKEDFAQATGRIEAYKHIPYYTGTFALQKVGQYILGSPPYEGEGPVQRAFEDEMTPGGEEWQELSDTQKFYRKGDGPILDESGDLKRAATSESAMMSIAVTGQYARLLMTPEALQDETRFKFFVHQLGSSNGWGMDIEIPARPFFPEGPEDLNYEEEKRIQEIIREGVSEGVKERQDEYARRRRVFR